MHATFEKELDIFFGIFMQVFYQKKWKNMIFWILTNNNPKIDLLWQIFYCSVNDVLNYVATCMRNSPAWNIQIITLYSLIGKWPVGGHQVFREQKIYLILCAPKNLEHEYYQQTFVLYRDTQMTSNACFISSFIMV